MSGKGRIACRLAIATTLKESSALCRKAAVAWRDVSRRRPLSKNDRSERFQHGEGLHHPVESFNAAGCAKVHCGVTSVNCWESLFVMLMYAQNALPAVSGSISTRT